MITIRNKFIPLKDFTALTIWPFVFVRNDKEYSDVTARHEAIHGEQQKEMLVILFYLWYVIEWLVKCIIYRNTMTAYKNISFEREAYDNQHLLDYQRKHYSWIKYL